MSRFREELKVVPRTAWAIAVLVYVGFATLAWSLLIPRDEKISGWPLVGQVLFMGIPPIFLFVLVVLIGYVNGDAKRRGMRHVLWTLLAIFIPNAIGIILYFILRDPPMGQCPKCGGTVRGGFAFCPSCGTPLADTCPGCKRVIEPGWSHCPNCGRGLRAA